MTKVKYMALNYMSMFAQLKLPNDIAIYVLTFLDYIEYCRMIFIKPNIYKIWLNSQIKIGRNSTLRYLNGRAHYDIKTEGKLKSSYKYGFLHSNDTLIRDRRITITKTEYGLVTEMIFDNNKLSFKYGLQHNIINDDIAIIYGIKVFSCPNIRQLLEIKYKKETDIFNEIMDHIIVTRNGIKILQKYIYIVKEMINKIKKLKFDGISRNRGLVTSYKNIRFSQLYTRTHNIYSDYYNIHYISSELGKIKFHGYDL